MSSRSAALDGFRGIAIIAVILNHIPLTIWTGSLPLFLRPFLDIFLAGGKTGVCILFLLTGFLMSWLYPALSNPISFWSRRYARLFPSFLVMVISLSLIKNNHYSIPAQILIILTFALIGRLLWEFCLRLNSRFSLGKLITILFISLQILTALWYSFYLLKIPSPVFYQTWSRNIQIVITALVNGTLTLPFGNYIGQIDGVYWSLITEVSFYLLYPILFIPLFSFVNRQKSSLWKTLLIVSSLPFCWNLYLLSLRTPGFSTMIPHLYIYFIVGVAVGSNLVWFQEKLSKLSSKYLLPLFILVFSGPLIYPYIPQFYHPWVGLFLVFPLSLILIKLSTENSPWGKFFNQKWLTFFGKYSYSLYLTHALCVEIAQNFITPNTPINGLFLVIVVFSLSIGLSWCLFQIIEQPYYLLPKSAKTTSLPVPHFLEPRLAFLLVTLIFIYFAYRPPLSLFTSLSFSKPTSPITLTSTHSYVIPFTAVSPHLGMITSPIFNLKSNSTDFLSISLFDSQNTIISQSKYRLSEIVNGRFHPFGFPVIATSLNQKYYLEYKIISSDPSSQAQIDTSSDSINLVYFVDKKDLFKNPLRLFSWSFSKLTEPFYNSGFWISLAYVFPLLFLLGYPSLTKLIRR